MGKWYWKDGTLAADHLENYPTEKEWLEKMRVVNDRLGDFGYQVLKQDVLPNGKWVSTVWIGLDQSFSLDESHTPIIFETMVFPKKGEWGELDMDRYCTEKGALEGHARMVEKWSKTTDKEES